jgi:hypothetical protein
MKHFVQLALILTLMASSANAQTFARPRPVPTIPSQTQTAAPPPPPTVLAPIITRRGGMDNRATVLQPTPYLTQSDFRTLIGEVGTPNDFTVPAFNNSFRVSPLAPDASGKGALATRDALAAPDYVSEIVGGGASFNFVRQATFSYDAPKLFDSIQAGGAEITINALRGEVYALDCLADVNGDPNATMYYRTSLSASNSSFGPEQSVTLKNYHFVTLVKRGNQNGDLKILLRPDAYLLAASSNESATSYADYADRIVRQGLENARRMQLTPEQRAAEDAAKAAASQAPPPPPPPIPEFTMKLWGCQVSSAQ